MTETPQAQVFETLRPAVLARLVELRASIDDAYAGMGEGDVRAEFDTILAQLHAHLEDPVADRLRDFAERWVAVRLGEGQSPRSLLHSVVALGDVVVQVAKSELPQNAASAAFVRDVVHANFTAARAVVEVLAGDVERRRAQLQKNTAT